MMKIKSQTVKFSTDITILTFFYYMPLNYSEKDTEEPASIVQTLGAPVYEMKRKSHVLHTQSFFVCMKKNGVGLPRMVRVSFIAAF